jgi:hypothetical protein
MKKETMAQAKEKKEFIFRFCLMPWNVVFTVPLFGEFSDVIWATMAAFDDQNV